VQGSIDARSSKPPVKEDEVDHGKRRESTEKEKSTKDLEKKKEKKKNLERQALETRRAKSRKVGCLRRTLPMRTMTTRATTAATTLRGWRPVSTESSRARRKPTSSSHGRETLRGRRAGPAMANGGLFSMPFSRRHPSRAYPRSDHPPPPTVSRV